MSTEEFEVLEMIMFRYPRDWGRRVIKKSDGEILLQTTGDGGQTWDDAPIPEAKLMMSATKIRAASTTDGNPYAGLSVVPRDEAMTMAVSASEKELTPVIIEAIESGQLLRKTTEVKTDSDNPDKAGDEIETISFLGTFAVSGLTYGQLYVDDNNFVKIA